MRRFSLLFLVLPLLLSACDSGEDVEEGCEGGSLQVVDVSVGTGATAAESSTVVVDYVGRLESGRAFESRADVEFELTRAIPGFRQGVAGMREGGSRRLTIPPALAYREPGVTDPRTGAVIIPPCETLTFEVTLDTVR